MISDRQKIRLLLVDDHNLVLDGLQARLELEEFIDVIGTASNGLEALNSAHQLHPDVVLMDVSMPVLNGLEAVKRFKQELPHIKVLMLSMHHEKEYILSLVQSGANGYVLKDVSSQELIRAIRIVHEGGTYFSSGASDALFVASPTPCDNLSKREMSVLRELAKGLSNKEIATVLNISVRTVETHRQNIKAKLNIHSAAALLRYAIDNKIV